MAAPMKLSMSAKKRKLGDLSVDEFMMGDFESSGSESEQITKKSKPAKSNRKGKKRNKNKGPQDVPSNDTQKSPVSKHKTSLEKLKDKPKDAISKHKTSLEKLKAKPKGVISKHKASLEKLKDQDPEFFEFLKDEDESLLNFDDVSGSDVSDTSDEDDTSKSDDPVNKNNDDDDDDNFPMSSDEEISSGHITKFLERKNELEIEQLKKEALASFSPGMSKKKTGPSAVDAKLTKLKEKGKNKALDKPDKVSDKKKAQESRAIKERKHKTVEPLKDKGKGNTEQKGGEIVEEEDSSDNSDDDGAVEFDNTAFDMDASDDSDEELLHKPPQELEVMSDSEDEESEEDDPMKTSGGKTPVTMKMIREWTKRFKEKPSPALIHEAVYAFKAAVQHTALNAVPTKYKVEGSKVYNAVVRMCLVEIPSALQTVLDLPATTDLQKPVLPTSKNQRWKKVRLDMKSYLADVLKLLNDLSEANMVNVILKHMHKLISFYASFQKLTKDLLKKVVTIWSSGEETSRVLAFLCINRLIRIHKDQNLENCIKQMYMAYVRNCKFTSPNTLPMINFMQRSFVEILALDFSLAYQHAFIYIRQLAIHLRNAITTKKKESCQAVYNWQFVHCLSLWSRVLSATYPNEVLEPLIYPLVQTTIGTIKLIPTQRYYPLRFHCVKALTLISRSTKTFIPVLPFLLEVFEQTDFNKKHKSLSLKPVNFACILKFSKAQIQDKTFKDGVIDQLYELLLEHFHAHAHSIGFPELALPALLQLKEFLKKCKVSNFTKQVKQIVDKVDENCKFITARRRTANISLADNKAIDRWEWGCHEAGTPLSKFYTTWRKLRDRELMHRIAARDEIVDTKLPEIKRPQKGMQKATDTDKKEFSALFDSDSDDDDIDLTESFLPPDEKRKLMKEKKMKEKLKSVKNENDAAAANDDDDNYEDFDSDELEQLAGSGPDDDDVEYDDGKQNDDVDDDKDDDDKDDDEQEDDEEDDDDIPEGDDIVKEFTMSSDEDDD